MFIWVSKEEFGQRKIPKHSFLNSKIGRIHYYWPLKSVIATLMNTGNIKNNVAVKASGASSHALRASGASNQVSGASSQASEDSSQDSSQASRAT